MKINTKSKNNLLFLVLILALGTGSRVLAQQAPNYTQYMYNTMILNPGYTGTSESLEANLLYRNQWVGFEGAPEIQNFSIHSPLRNPNLGLGLNLTNDVIGPSSEFSLRGNFSYKIRTGRQTQLSLGVNAGARMLNIDWSKGRFYDQDDVLLNNNINNSWKPSLGAGAYFYSDKWYLGFSVPNFIQSDYYDDIEEAVLSDRVHYFLIGGYVFDLSRSVQFKPAFFTRVVNGAPLSTDISANFLLKEVVSLGTSYRWDDSVSLLAGFQVNRNFFLGYSYDYTVSDLNKYNDGTHEFILRYQLLNQRFRLKSPRFF